MRKYHLTKIITFLLILNTTKAKELSRKFEVKDFDGCGSFRLKGMINSKKKQFLIYPKTKKQIALALKPLTHSIFTAHHGIHLIIEAERLHDHSEIFITKKGEVIGHSESLKTPIQKLKNRECLKLILQKADRQKKK